MTEWGQFNSFASPGGSSGLAIASRFHSSLQFLPPWLRCLNSKNAAERGRPVVLQDPRPPDAPLWRGVRGQERRLQVVVVVVLNTKGNKQLHTYYRLQGSIATSQPQSRRHRDPPDRGHHRQRGQGLERKEEAEAGEGVGRVCKQSGNKSWPDHPWGRPEPTTSPWILQYHHQRSWVWVQGYKGRKHFYHSSDCWNRANTRSPLPLLDTRLTRTQIHEKIQWLWITSLPRQIPNEQKSLPQS